MATPVTDVFINLCVKDLAATQNFWLKLGFTFNPQFTDQNAASLVLGKNIYAMLIVPDYFQQFTKKTIADAHTTTEAINALGLESRQAVDDVMTKALAAGATETRPTEDHGWMYGRSFSDLDGHQWELTYIDITNVPANPATA